MEGRSVTLAVCIGYRWGYDTSPVRLLAPCASCRWHQNLVKLTTSGFFVWVCMFSSRKSLYNESGCDDPTKQPLELMNRLIHLHAPLAKRLCSYTPEKSMLSIYIIHLGSLYEVLGFDKPSEQLLRWLSRSYGLLLQWDRCGRTITHS